MNLGLEKRDNITIGGKDRGEIGNKIRKIMVDGLEKS